MTTIRIPSSDDIVLGSTVSLPGVKNVPFLQVRLTKAQQRLHGCIWGKTGSGKSKLNQSIWLQHVEKGHGVGLIEPHRDLSLDCLRYLVGSGFFRNHSGISLPELTNPFFKGFKDFIPNSSLSSEAADDPYSKVVYIDWGNDGTHFVPFNVLAGDGDPYVRANNVLEAFLRCWPSLENAPLFQTLLLSSLMVLMAQTPPLPLTYLYPLLTNPSVRKACLANVNDPLIRGTFEDYFDRLGRNQMEAAGSTLRRAFLTSFSPALRYTLGQPDNWLNFRRFMDAQISFIINLGSIPDTETRNLVGALLEVQIEQAAMSRSNIPEAQRKPFVLIIDEWPAFSGGDKTLGTILSQVRKYGLTMLLSAQSLSQISSERLAGALENCNVTCCFSLGRESAEVQAKNIGKFDISLLKEPALTESQHSMFQSVQDQMEQWASELQDLPPRYMWCKVLNDPAVRIQTLEVDEPEVDEAEFETVVNNYQSRYQRSLAEVKEIISRIPVPGGSEEAQRSTEETAGERDYSDLYQNPFLRRRNQKGDSNGEKLPN